jgi:hypothetical protein
MVFRSAACDTFYVVKQRCLTSTPETITVLHQVPTGTEELASFDNPNQAIDFAEATVRELRAIGSPVELVDPPYGLVGAG